MGRTASRDGSSTSAPRPSPRSPRSRRASLKSASPGRRSSPSNLTPSAVRALADRHGIRPRKSLGQHFLIEPALARRIVELSAVEQGSRVLEIGAGLGSLTMALAAAGARVLAVEVDPRLVPVLTEVTAGLGEVTVVVADAVSADWSALLEGSPWTVVANLPYNVAVPVVMRLLDLEPRVTRMLVMVQREVGERLAAGPGDEQYGAVSVRVAYRAEARVVRRVPPSVFWPRPRVESVLVSLALRPPPVDVDRVRLWRVIEVAFEQRRKTMRQAVLRLGIEPTRAEAVLAACGIGPRQRPEELGLTAFACLARAPWPGPGGDADA